MKLQCPSQARTKALFDEEQQFIAPGLQTIALLSELAIAHGSRSDAHRSRRTHLSRLERGRIGRKSWPRPSRYVAALTKQLEAVSVGSFTSQPRAELVRLIAEPRSGRTQSNAIFQRRRGSRRSRHSPGAFLHQANRHHRFHRRFPRKDRGRSSAFGRRLEEFDRAAPHGPSPRSLR